MKASCAVVDGTPLAQPGRRPSAARRSPVRDATERTDEEHDVVAQPRGAVVYWIRQTALL